MTAERMYDAMVEYELSQNPSYFVQKYFTGKPFDDDDWKMFNQMRKQDKILKRLKLRNRV